MSSGPWFLLVLISLFCLHVLDAQEGINDGQRGIRLRYKYYGDSTVLRWGFTHAVDWFHAKDGNVEIWRRNVTAKGKYEKIADVTPMDSTAIEMAASRMHTPDMMVVILENLHRNWHNTYFTDYRTLLEKSDNLLNRWSLVQLAADLDLHAANAAGLRFSDKSILPNTTYAYKIISGNMTDYTVVFPARRSERPVIYEIKEEESRVEVSWDKKRHDYFYTAYWVEMSLDGTTFHRVNERPFLQMDDANLSHAQSRYTFTIPSKNYLPIVLRLIGVDAFSDESQPSAPVRCMARDKTPPLQGELFADTAVTHLTKKLSWRVPNPSDVAKFYLERTHKDVVTRIENGLHIHQTSFTDTLTKEGVYKYRIALADSAGNVAYSSAIYTKVFDRLPPAKPSGLKAVQDTSGLVTLTWDTHPEADVIGYNIYVADKESRNFIKRNTQTVRQRYFTDSLHLHMLTRERSYYIVAVDNDFLRSVPSDTLTLVRADVVPPSPAIIADYEVRPEGIRLTLFPSSSADVRRHELWRRKGEGDWSVRSTFTRIPSSFTDTDVQTGTDYYYRFYAVDSSGLRSHNVKDIKLAAYPAIPQKPMLSFVLNGSVAEIMIRYPGAEYVEFLLYKSENERRSVLYKVLDSGRFSEIIKQGTKYNYTVRTRNKDGLMGPFSEPLTIQLP